MILYPLIGLGGSDNFSDIVKKSVDHTILTFKVLLLLLISFAVYLTSYYLLLTKQISFGYSNDSEIFFAYHQFAACLDLKCVTTHLALQD